MNKSLVLSLTLTTAVLGGCGKAALLKMPAVPEQKIETVSTTIEFSNDSNLDENVVRFEEHDIPRGSSVVINVPEKVFEDKSKREGKKQDLRTKDFFSEAEQAIEKELIRKRFRVLSRAKLEAELRRLRDENRCDDRDWHCLRSQVSPEVRPILDDLKEKFEKNQISASEYARQIAEFKGQMQSSSRGRSRSGDEKELTDISEVIRAAQSSEIKADYILQINVFETDKDDWASTDLTQNEEIRLFLRSHPEAQQLMRPEATRMISCAITAAALNAKLIHVKTGSIVWIGNHELNELNSGVQNLEMTFGQKTYVTNANDVRRFVNSQNSDEARKRRKKREVQIPEWKYKTELIMEKTAGRCEATSNIDEKEKRNLSRNVAKELIERIVVN